MPTFDDMNELTMSGTLPERSAAKIRHRRGLLVPRRRRSHRDGDGAGGDQREQDDSRGHAFHPILLLRSANRVS